MIDQITHWIQAQNWFVLSFAIVGWLNCIIAFTKAMGWARLADFCSRLENAIQATVQAALNRNQQQIGEKK